MRLLLLVALTVAVSSRPTSEKWAVLVSGSKNYMNYRHQADVCHSYHVLIDRGFNPNNIIVFSFNDVLPHYLNPLKFQLYNRPDMPGKPAKDVNLGCKKDYTGGHVTPTNFYNVLTGNSAAMAGIGTGKVLKSDKYDNVFIFFTGHGGHKLIAFPNQLMSADMLISTFQTMYSKQMYNKMLVYLEASKSGSMFDGLLNPSWNILAVTSTNPSQNSYPTYCPPNDVVDGVHIGACLGTKFGVTWMEDADKMIAGESILEQFIKLNDEIELSEVSMYGDTGFILDQLASFIGVPTFDIFPISKTSNTASNTWPSTDSGLISLLATYVSDSSDSTANELIKTIQSRERSSKVFERFVEEIFDNVDHIIIQANNTTSDFRCFNAGVKAYESYCGPFDEYSLTFTKHIDDACDSQVSISRIQAAFRDICRRIVINPACELKYESEPKSDLESSPVTDPKAETYTLVESKLAY